MVPVIFMGIEGTKMELKVVIWWQQATKGRSPFIGRIHPARCNVLKKNGRLRQIECILYLSLAFPVFFTSTLLRIIQCIKLK